MTSGATSVGPALFCGEGSTAGWNSVLAEVTGKSFQSGSGTGKGYGQGPSKPPKYLLLPKRVARSSQFKHHQLRDVFRAPLYAAEPSF